ncbi:MAG: DUF4037 domain-containing protein [Clostridiales bacterium]|nr:DUF4037 domain-containing protein [Clostridiales bacterium]
MSQTDNSRRFYQKHVEPMIRSEFGMYEDRIAVGLAGEGSDCFGYDDFMSRDHDFGTGVCLWLTEADYELFGESLRDAYDALIAGMPGNDLTARLKARRGVMTIDGFYSNILGISVPAEERKLTEEEWLALDHSCLATAVNGEVFRDDLGVFSSFRSYLLSYYPDHVWRFRLADELHKFASSLQVNYARCMSRGDTVAARMCHLNGLSASIELFFLLHRQYPPYYKWTYRRMCEIEDGLYAQRVKALADAVSCPEVWEGKQYSPGYLNLSDPVVLNAEMVAESVLDLMSQLGLITGSNKYLEKYVDVIMK